MLIEIFHNTICNESQSTSNIKQSTATEQLRTIALRRVDWCVRSGFMWTILEAETSRTWSRTAHVHLLMYCVWPEKNYHGYLYSTKNDTLKANKENAITSVSRDWVPRLLNTNNDYSIIMSCLIFGLRVHETTSETRIESIGIVLYYETMNHWHCLSYNNTAAGSLALRSDVIANCYWLIKLGS